MNPDPVGTDVYPKRTFVPSEVEGRKLHPTRTFVRLLSLVVAQPPTPTSQQPLTDMRTQEREIGLPVDTLAGGFHNRRGAFPVTKKSPTRDSASAPASQPHALEDAVARALRDNLIPLQRTAQDLQNAYSDLVAACGSARPTNALPAMVRAQSAAASLSAALAVLSNFVTIALQPRERAAGSEARDAAAEMASAFEIAPPEVPAAVKAPPAPAEAVESEWAREEADTIVVPGPVEEIPIVGPEPLPVAGAEPSAEVAMPVFELAKLPTDVQELHRRANRVAKVAMQDIKLLRPKDVRLGCENKDLCTRLRADLDKARKEYDRRFKTILDHPVDYFHDWMVAILAEGDSEALGEYPYPTPVLHH